ncbi:MAG: hypothetical protein ACXVZQ_08240 [Terriglobales bacterium]
MGDTPTFAVLSTAGSAFGVAHTVTTWGIVTLGAVKKPVLVIVPLVAFQVTAVLELPVTVAVNCWVPPDGTEAPTGEMVSVTGPVVVEVPEPPVPELPVPELPVPVLPVVVLPVLPVLVPPVPVLEIPALEPPVLELPFAVEPALAPLLAKDGEWENELSLVVPQPIKLVAAKIITAAKANECIGDLSPIFRAHTATSNMPKPPKN